MTGNAQTALGHQRRLFPAAKGGGKAWDDEPLSVLVKKDAPRATGAHISIIGHITLIEARKLLTDLSAANGFANRFLWVLTQRVQYLPFGGELDREDLTAFVQKLGGAVDLAKETREIQFDQETRQHWEKLYRDLSKGEPGVFGTVVNRAETQTLRLACVYALLDSSATIKLPHLRAALAVWKYCEASAKYIFGDKLGDALADDILGVLRDNPNGMTRWELHVHFHGHKTSTEIAEALALLKQLGHADGKKQAAASGGRPAERWYAI